MLSSINLDIAKIYMKNGWRVVLVDRAILFIDIFVATGLTFLMQMMLWKYIYKDSGEVAIQGKTFSDILLYYLYVICLNRFNNGYGIIEDISYTIYSGKIELALVKPFSFKLQKMFDYLGGSLVYLPLALLPLIIDVTMFSNYTVYTGLGLIVGYLVLLVLSQVLCFLLAFIISLITFKSENSGVVLALYSILAAFLGGALLPANYWPESMRLIMEFNPFSYTMGAISEFSLAPSINSFLSCLTGLLIYICIFNLVSNKLWKMLTRDYKGLGG